MSSPQNRVDRSTGASPFAALSAVGPTRGRPRRFDRSAVIEAALRIVEADGLGGLTMRKVADRLGASMTTVYKIVDSKEALLDDLVEVVFEQLPQNDRASGRETDALVHLWSAVHELLVEHPAVAQLTALKPAGGPSLFVLIESTLRLLREAGVEQALITTAFETIRGYTLGYTLLRISRNEPASVVAERRLAHATRSDPDRFPEIIARTPEMSGAITGTGYEAGLGRLLQSFLPDGL